MYEKDQLCFSCAKACGKCSWSYNLVPVDGWTARFSILPNNIETFKVIKCPQYEFDGCVLGVYTLTTHMKTRQNGTKTANITEILKDLAIVQAIKTDIGDKHWYMSALKDALRKIIVPIIQSYITDKTTMYIEPFVGGGNTIQRINFHTKIGYDIDKYVIALLRYCRRQRRKY